MDTDTTTYGPQTREVEALLCRIAELTFDQARRLEELAETLGLHPTVQRRALAQAARLPGRLGAINAAISAAVASVSDVWEDVPRISARKPAIRATWQASQMACTNALVGLVLRDILHPADYKTLTAPVFNALGVGL